VRNQDVDVFYRNVPEDGVLQVQRLHELRQRDHQKIVPLDGAHPLHVGVRSGLVDDLHRVEVVEIKPGLKIQFRLHDDPFLGFLADGRPPRHRVRFGYV